jgi:hypothetical protein
MRQFIGRKAQHKQVMTMNNTQPAQALEILRPAQTQILLHLASVPVHLLHMHRRNRQDVTPLGATRLQNLATPTSRHASAKAVYASTTADFRLIRALCRHFAFYSC